MGDTTFMNVYPKSGTDVESRREREIMFSNTIPHMLIHRKSNLIIGGDWNAITDNIDATHHPEAKHSPALRRMIVMLKLKDCFRIRQGRKKHYSHYYKKDNSDGATRIDRIYVSDQTYVSKAEYTPVAFSDHHGHTTTVKMNSNIAMLAILEFIFTVVVWP